MSKALLFSGQGAQQVGMGKSLYENISEVRKIWDEAQSILNFELTTICFEGPDETLKRTKICQPALYVLGYSLFKCLEQFNKLDEVQVAMGLSLGELTALAVANVYDFETGLTIVAKRGKLMQEACDKTDGAMASIIGGELGEIKGLVKEFDIDIANYNSPGQIVISGEKSKVKEATEKAKEMDFKHVIPLKVAGAYHSRLMKHAADKFEVFLKDIEFKVPMFKVFTNTTGQEISNPEEIKNALVKQIISPVKWDSCMKNAIALGINEFYECGPGKVLTGLARRIDKSAYVIPFLEYQDFI